MLQNYVADQIRGLSPFVASPSVVNPTPHLRATGVSPALESRLCGRYTFTPAVNDYSGLSVGVVDPDFLGPMVLSYSMSWVVSGGTPLVAYPFVLDRQATVPLGAGNLVAFAAAANELWSFADPVGSLGAAAVLAGGFRGRMLVDTRITSATPGITVREFLVGFCIRYSAATLVDLAYSLDIRLHARDKRFLQPSK